MGEDQIINDQIAIALKETNSLLKETNLELKGIKDWISAIALLPIIGVAVFIAILVAGGI